MASWKARPSSSRSRQQHSPWWLLVPILALMIGGACRGSAHAENATACPEDNIDECARYQHLVSGMDSGDFAVQLASLRAASQELDPALRALIFGKALKSSDLRLRTGGLRYVLASRTTFDVVVESPVHATPAQQKLYQQYGSLTLHRVQLDEKTDEIISVHRPSSGEWFDDTGRLRAGLGVLPFAHDRRRGRRD